jgi:hypothetical protein
MTPRCWLVWWSIRATPTPVYACAPGKLWSDSPDRGPYKTDDGGKSWDLILAGPILSIGCSAVALDPKNPDVVDSGLWDFRRKGWTFRSGGNGPNGSSGSAHGGATWERRDNSQLTRARRSSRPRYGSASSEPTDGRHPFARGGTYRSRKRGSPADANEELASRPFGCLIETNQSSLVSDSARQRERYDTVGLSPSDCA